MEHDRPRFLPGAQVALAERYQAFIDNEQTMLGIITGILDEKPETDTIIYTGSCSKEFTARIPLKLVEPMFSRAHLAYRLEGLSVGLDLGHDEFLRRCVLESASSGQT